MILIIKKLNDKIQYSVNTIDDIFYTNEYYNIFKDIENIPNINKSILYDAAYRNFHSFNQLKNNETLKIINL